MTWTPTTLAGWGNLPREVCRLARPADDAALLRLAASDDPATFIPRGLGRAYGDSALNAGGGVLEMTRRQCLLAFDPIAGRLTAEAGVSIGELLEVFLPRGWMVPVSPGTRFVTLGGAVASDVHGKNQHVDGAFGDWVDSFDILTADGAVRTCTPLQNGDLFRATVGGQGLTGVILRVTLRLRPVESAWIVCDYVQTPDLDAVLEKLRASESTHRYSVAWIDALARGRRTGRSVLMLGREARPDEVPARWRDRPLQPLPLGARAVPFDLPNWTLNAWSVGLFNRIYRAAHPTATKVVDLNAYFYPLDAIRHWNRIYGKRGFIQYQALFPPESAHRGLREALETIAASGRASFLAVLKSCGRRGPGILSFTRPGYTLALDLSAPHEALRELVDRLDRIVVAQGGTIFLAKDAMTSAKAFADMTPELDAFREARATFDPEGRWASSQARRLGVIAASGPRS